MSNIWMRLEVASTHILDAVCLAFVCVHLRASARICVRLCASVCVCVCFHASLLGYRTLCSIAILLCHSFIPDNFTIMRSYLPHYAQTWDRSNRYKRITAFP